MKNSCPRPTWKATFQPRLSRKRAYPQLHRLRSMFSVYFTLPKEIHREWLIRTRAKIFRRWTPLVYPRVYGFLSAARIPTWNRKKKKLAIGRTRCSREHEQSDFRISISLSDRAKYASSKKTRELCTRSFSFAWRRSQCSQKASNCQPLASRAPP